VEALVQAPDILLLDEPTNHLDLAGIRGWKSCWKAPASPVVAVSHDRYFLETVATEMANSIAPIRTAFCAVHGTTARS